MVFWQTLFSLFIFFLPTQLGWHFWPRYSYVFGLKIDYLSPTLFLTDVLLVLALIAWWVQRYKQLSRGHSTELSRGPQVEGGRKAKRYKETKIALGVFFFLLINIFFAQNHWLAFWKSLKVLEIFLLAYLVFKESNLVIKTLERLLPWVVIYESIISLCQFMKQGSLGGLFWFLGERSFSLMTPMIAKGEFLGRLFLRPYATFSHPNSLAGFMLVCLIIILVKRKFTGIDVAALVLGTITIFLSFSRVVLVSIFILVPYYFSKVIKIKSDRKIVLAVGLVFIIFFSVLLVNNSSFEESYFQRVELNEVAIKLFLRSPIVGIGLNNFIPVMANQKNFGQVYWLQPVHNIFLLLIAETGLIGLTLFLILIIKLFRFLSPFAENLKRKLVDDREEFSASPGTVRYLASEEFRSRRRGVLYSTPRSEGRRYPERKPEGASLKTRNIKFLMVTVVITLTGLFDHYWLTLQQNLLLLGIVIGVSYFQKKR